MVDWSTWIAREQEHHVTIITSTGPPIDTITKNANDTLALAEMCAVLNESEEKENIVGRADLRI